MAFVTTDDGVKIYYEDRGSPPVFRLATDSGPPAQCGRTKWKRFSDCYQVIAWDMRGHVADPLDDPAAYSVERGVGDMAAMIMCECIADRAAIGDFR